MKSIRWLILSTLCIALLPSCLNTGVKTLGKKVVGGTGTPTTDADSFSITAAYRKDVSPDDGLTVTLQGTIGVASANLVNLCGAAGASCTCEFYQGTSDTAPKGSSSVGISSSNNSYSCVINNGGVDPDLFTYVKIKTTDGAKTSGLIKIDTTLTLEQVLGSLDKKKVRKIFRYECQRTFFEGEGVNANAINCTASQRLGIVSAPYNFYLYQSQEDTNFPAYTVSTFDGDICERTDFFKVNCTGATPVLRYGLYKQSAAPFIVGVTMTKAPEGDNSTEIFGYAALPDNAGNCPLGLIKIRPYVVQPPSIIAGMFTNPDGQPSPGSSFINVSNNLNNTLVEAETDAPAANSYTVTRQPNAYTGGPGSGGPRCNANPPPQDENIGSCKNATFAGSTTALTASYNSLTPVVCAIPRDLLTGI
ncbi:MAG: hypothetical protein M9962_09840 [Oligoflexia bacterium]|nr:hypothetical protein [Oligoflexia bacterium]